MSRNLFRFLMVTGVAVAAASFVLLMYILVPPPLKDGLGYTVNEVRVSQLDVNSSRLTATFLIELLAYHTFCPIIKYHSMTASVLFGDQLVASSPIETNPSPNFKVVDASYWRIRTSIVASSVSIDPSLADAILIEKQQRGMITFDIRVTASFVATKTLNIYPKKKGDLVVICPGIRVGYFDNPFYGVLMGQYFYPCHEHVYNITHIR